MRACVCGRELWSIKSNNRRNEIKKKQDRAMIAEIRLILEVRGCHNFLLLSQDFFGRIKNVFSQTGHRELWLYWCFLTVVDLAAAKVNLLLNFIELQYNLWSTFCDCKLIAKCSQNMVFLFIVYSPYEVQKYQQ